MKTEIKAQGVSQGGTDDHADVKKLLVDFFNIWPVVVVLIIVNLLVAYFISRSTNPIYQIEAAMVIKQDRTTVSQELFESIGIKPTSNIENEIAVLSSFNLAYNTIKSLDFNTEYFKDDIWKNEEVYHGLPYQVEVDWNHNQLLEGALEITMLNATLFNLQVKDSKFKLYRPEHPDQWFTMDKKISLGGHYQLNSWVQTPYCKFRLVATSKDLGVSNFSFNLKSNYMLAEQYSKMLKVEIQKKESTILNLVLETSMVDKGKLYLEKIIEAYQSRELKNKNLTATNTATFINQQLKSIKDSLVFFEDKLERYRTNNQTFNLDQQSSLVLNRISELQNEQANALLKVRYYENVSDYLRNDKINKLVVPSAIGIQEPLVDHLINELVTVQEDRLRVTQVLSNDNKAVKELNFRYNTLANTLKESITRSREATDVLLRDLGQRLEKLKAELGNMPQVERDLLSIKRQFAISENIYTYLLQKRDEAEISRASNIPASEVLDYPRRIGGMISPKPVRNYFIGLSLAIIVPLLFIFFKSVFNQRIHDYALLEKKLVVPLVGVIGRGPKGKSKNVVNNLPRSYITENFRNIRANIKFLFNPEKNIVVAFTSSVSSEGKTFCSINTSAIYAIGGRKTILVGLDLRKPKIAEDFNIENDAGVSNYLCSTIALKELIKTSGQPNLDILLSGPLPPNPAELIGSSRFTELIDELRSAYEVVILDCPPIGLVSETIDICNHADLSFYMFRHQFSNWDTVQNLNDLVQKGLIKKVYAIYNDLSKSSNFNATYGNYYHLENEPHFIARLFQMILTKITGKK